MRRVLLVIALAGSSALAQNVAPDRRAVGRYPDGRPIIMASLGGSSSEAYLEGFIMRVAGSARVPVGLERPRDSGVAAVERREPVLLSGRTVGDALTAILEAASKRAMPGAGAPRYRLQWTRGLAHVSAFVGRPTLLDQVVPSFAVQNVTLERAVEILLFQIHASPAPPPVPGAPNPTGLQPPKTLFARKAVSLSIAHATARDILNALVLESGDASWVARYANDPVDPRGAVFVLMSFDGRGIEIN